MGGLRFATMFFDAATTKAAVPGYLVASAGAASIVLVNPSPGGGASLAQTLRIWANVDGGIICDGGGVVCDSVNNNPCDPNNCGSCGNACAGGAICQSGTCVCPSGETVGGGVCPG